MFFNFGKTGAQAGAARTYYFDDLGFMGSRFTPAFARAAPRWMASVALGTLAMIGASADATASSAATGSIRIAAPSIRSRWLRSATD